MDNLEVVIYFRGKSDRPTTVSNILRYSITRYITHYTNCLSNEWFYVSF